MTSTTAAIAARRWKRRQRRGCTACETDASVTFHGNIGGLDLAAEMAGFVTVGQCEWADYPTKVLEKHWPDVPRWRDIRTLTGESFFEKTGLRTVDVLSGGFPCQPFSVAGQRRGKDDDRFLWPEMCRVIREIRPTWVLGENVPGIVDMALNQVLTDLETSGYEGQAFVVPACGVDAPHKRYRVAILAHAIDRGGAVRRDWELQDAPGDGKGRIDHGRGTAATLSGQRRQNKSRAVGMADGIRAEVYGADPDTDREGLEGRQGVQIRGGGGMYRHRLPELLECTPLGKIGHQNPEWTEWLMGYPIGWTELSA